jgi:hypothetical protein
MPVYRLADSAPTIAASAYIAPTATIIGRVVLQDHASVWFGAILRGDNEPITIGANSNVQDSAVLHTDPGFPLSVGVNVTVVSELRSEPDTDPALQAELEQRFEEIGRGLRAVSPGAYATLMLHRGHGVPLREVSERLNVSHTTTTVQRTSCTKFFGTRSWSTRPGIWFVPPFVAGFASCVFQPQISARLRERTQRYSDKQARRHADRGLNAARRLAPYEAEYRLEGDLLVLSRAKDGKWLPAWRRALGKYRADGLAIQVEKITAIFRRHSSLTPPILILQDGPDWTARVLQEVGLTVMMLHRGENTASTSRS